MKTLYLIRGVPGSGKSTLARLLAKELNARHYEADQYFEDEDGFYVFDKKKISHAHGFCRDMTEFHMKQRDCDIIVANTFVRLWEMRWYARKAVQYGYALQVIECKGQFKNIHGVPDQKVEEMLKNWECYHGIHQLLEDWLRPVDAVKVKHTALMRPTRGKVNAVSQPSQIKS